MLKHPAGKADEGVVLLFPDDEERYELILERSIPVIVFGETFVTKCKADLIKLCVENTLLAYGLVAKKRLIWWGTFVETEPEKYSLEEDAYS